MQKQSTAPTPAQLSRIGHQLQRLPHRCQWRRRQMQQPHAWPARLMVHSSGINSGSGVPRPVQCARQQSLVCRSWRKAYNGLTAGLNEPAGEVANNPELDMSLKGRCGRFVEHLYDWDIRSTNEKDPLNTREQAPLTWVDKASLALVRALQTVIMLALAWHVYAWLSSSVTLLAWRYSLAWPDWLTLK